MNPSSSLFLIGPTGAGKTSVGRRLANHYGLSFIDLDQEIERQTGVDIPTIFEIEGEAGFRQRESLLLDAITARGETNMSASAAPHMPSATTTAAAADVATRMADMAKSPRISRRKSPGCWQALCAHPTEPALNRPFMPYLAD